MKFKQGIFASILLLCLHAWCQEPTEVQQINISPLINGTLLLPDGEKKTLAIIIPDSGPVDRNGNQPMMQNNSLKMLAEGLFHKGIATFRYDKRLVVLLKKRDLDEKRIRFDDFVNDAREAIHYFKNAGYAEIVVIGHGQGALVAELALTQEPVDKLITLTPAGEAIDKIILDLLSAQAPALTENAQEAFTDLRKTGSAVHVSPPLMSFLSPEVQPFMLSWMQYDPAAILAKLTMPIMVISGSKDLQMPEGQGELLARANVNTKYMQIADMNHILKKIEGDDLENARSTNESGRPVVPELIDSVVKFINDENIH